ncbi:MAG: energy transducer TonB [Rhodomicrobium sp.]
MAHNSHSLRSFIAESDDGGSAFPGGVTAHYDLFAEAGGRLRTTLTNFAFPKDAAADTEVPAEFALRPEKRPIPARGRLRRLPWRAMVAALLLHLAILTFFLVRPAGQKPLGMEEGLPDTLNVSVISAADLQRFGQDAIRQEAQPSPVPPNEPAPPTEFTPPTPPNEMPVPAEAQIPPAQKPAEQDTKDAASLSWSKAMEKRDRPFDTSGFAAMAAEQFADQLSQAFHHADARREQVAKQHVSYASRNVRVMRPGATHIGKSDEFEKQVIWALGATVPMGNGKYGSTVVTFLVSTDGHVDGLKLLQSSGDNWLDTAALMAVRQAKMPVPPGGLPAGDRTFNIEYISLPGLRGRY